MSEYFCSNGSFGFNFQYRRNIYENFSIVSNTRFNIMPNIHMHIIMNNNITLHLSYFNLNNFR